MNDAYDTHEPSWMPMSFVDRRGPWNVIFVRNCLNLYVYFRYSLDFHPYLFKCAQNINGVHSLPLYGCFFNIRLYCLYVAARFSFCKFYTENVYSPTVCATTLQIDFLSIVSTVSFALFPYPLTEEFLGLFKF